MITLKDFYRTTEGLTLDYEVTMSNHTKEYTEVHPECSCNGYFETEDDSIIFNIDWNGLIKTTLLDFGECYSNYNENTKIISYDCDDGNLIKFDDIIIDKNYKYVIIV